MDLTSSEQSTNLRVQYRLALFRQRINDILLNYSVRDDDLTSKDNTDICDLDSLSLIYLLSAEGLDLALQLLKLSS